MSDLPASTGETNPAASDVSPLTVKAKPSKPPKPPKAPKVPKAPRQQSKPKAARQPGAPGRGAGCLAALLNVLAVLFVLASCLAGALVGLLFQYPGVLRFVPGGSAYMPATELAIVQALSSPTPGSRVSSAAFPTLPPVWTPTNTPTITPTPGPGTPTLEPTGTLPVPTYTDTATTTPSPTPTAPTPTPSRTPGTPPATRSAYAYTLQPGSPTYLANFINTSGCNWFGVVGRAFGLDGNPVLNLTVHLEGGGLDTDVITGSGPGALGPGGYEIPLSDHPMDTTDVYMVQLRNNTGTPFSAVYSLTTYGDCGKNLVMVNFVQNH